MSFIKLMRRHLYIMKFLKSVQIAICTPDLYCTNSDLHLTFLGRFIVPNMFKMVKYGTLRYF